MAKTLYEPCPSCGSKLDITGAPLFARRTCPVCQEMIHVHRTFSHYELSGLIGQGGQGTVYRATDTKLNRLVALKVLRVDEAGGASFEKQFEHEAQLTASINHPNVVRVYSFGSEDGTVFIAMELVDGGTMDDLMEKLGRVPEARVLQIGIQVAEGLRAGFEKGLIHRDVKPGNILFSSDGSAKVVDFGLAVFQEQQAAQSGDIWGTPYYLSPERLNRQPEDFRSDIYSLGASLFHAIAGRPPFEAEDAGHVALKHLRTQAVSIQTYAPDVTNATAYVINRTLAKNPNERQSSYAEFIEQLQYARDEVMARNRAGGAAPGKSRVVIEDAADRRATNWLAFAMFGVLLLGAVVGGWLVVKAMRGGSLGDAVTGEAKKVRLEDFGPGWGEAKQLLLDGKFTEASAAFGTLAENASAGSAQADWAVIHRALAEQFANGGDAAYKALGKLPDSGTQVRKFFREQIRPRLEGASAIRAKEAAMFNARNHEALGALFLALRAHENGQTAEAGPLFSQFTNLAPDSSIAWLAGYRALAKSQLDQFTTYNLAADAWKNARNEHEKIQALAALRGLPAKLPKDSALVRQAERLLAEAKKELEKVWLEKNRGNVAFRAKAKASVSAKGDGPENALDGDPTTRWSASGPGQKWLAVDLGSPRNISRWALISGAFDAPKRDDVLAAFKLQRSDDGEAWADVDIVQDNRCGVIDRVVEPFTARHVRVLVLKENAKPGDKTARIHEFLLGNATDQARAAYDAQQSVAFRFSVKSEFLTGAVGEGDAQGAVMPGEAEGTFTVKTPVVQGGQGDLFQFLWLPVAGDCEVVARLVSVQPPGAQVRTGVMIRGDVARDSAFVAMTVQASSRGAFSSRPGPARLVTSTDLPGMKLPRWLKVARKGDRLTAFESADGTAWTQTGEETLAGLKPVAFAGVAVNATRNGQSVTAQFTDVRIRKAGP